MNFEHVLGLRRAFGLEALADQGAQRSGFFVWNLALDPDDLEGWRQADCQYALLPGSRQYLTGVWMPIALAPQRGCRLDLTCHPSRESALDEVAGRLDAMQVDAASWRPDVELGERAWATANLGTLIWLHGNLVGSAAKMGPDSVAPLELAQAVERFLLRQAEMPATLPSRARGAAAPPRVGVGPAAPLAPRLRSVLAAARSPTAAGVPELPYPVPNAVLAGPRSQRPPLVRVLADGGRVALTGTGLEFVPTRPGQVGITTWLGAAGEPAAPSSWHANATPDAGAAGKPEELK